MKEKNIKQDDIHQSNKKLSFASLQNSSFNLSFKDFQFEKQKVNEQDKDSSIAASSTPSKWIRVVNEESKAFQNHSNIIENLKPDSLKVSVQYKCHLERS